MHCNGKMVDWIIKLKNSQDAEKIDVRIKTRDAWWASVAI
jgi:hypothetical protein